MVVTRGGYLSVENDGAEGHVRVVGRWVLVVTECGVGALFRLCEDEPTLLPPAADEASEEGLPALAPALFLQPAGGGRRCFEVLEGLLQGLDPCGAVGGGGGAADDVVVDLSK